MQRLLQETSEDINAKVVEIDNDTVILLIEGEKLKKYIPIKYFQIDSVINLLEEAKEINKQENIHTYST